MTLSEQVSTVHFYSRQIGVAVKDGQIYVNWNDFLILTGTKTEIAPHRFNTLLPDSDERYVSLAYINKDIQAFTPNTLLGELIENEFCNHVIKELVVQMKIRPVDLSYPEYKVGIFEIASGQYILPHAIQNHVGNQITDIPEDVVRIPTAIIVEGGPEGPFMFPTWLVELSSVPYIISSHLKRGQEHSRGYSRELARIILGPGDEMNP